MTAASMRGSAGVLDLRDRLHSWRRRPAKTTLVPHEQAARHGGWEAILRDGMVVIESRPDPEPDHRFWTVLGTFSKPDLRRLRDLIDEILEPQETPRGR